jgi:hypothetical protein
MFESLAPVQPDSPQGHRLPLLNFLAFICVVVFNALASTGALSQYDVGEVSRLYQTLITPAGYAFSIWGIIYFSVAVFCIWQCIPSWRDDKLVFGAIGYWFIVSCVANVLWIVIFVQATTAAVWISSVLLFIIFGSLLQIILRAKAWERALVPQSEGDNAASAIIRKNDFASSPLHESSPGNDEVSNQSDSAMKRFFSYFSVDWTFSIYCGWTTAASILNVSCSLVGVGYYGGKHVSQQAWAVVMLAIASIIYSLMIIRKWNWAYGAVFTWAAIAISNGEQCGGDVATKDGVFDDEDACTMVQRSAFVMGVAVGVLASIRAIRWVVKMAQTPKRAPSVPTTV